MQSALLIASLLALLALVQAQSLGLGIAPLSIPTTQVINGITLKPGPALLGISPGTDLGPMPSLPSSFHTTREMHLEARSSTQPTCYNINQVNTTVVNAMISYFQGLAAQQFCSTQLSQYLADCQQSAFPLILTAVDQNGKTIGQLYYGMLANQIYALSFSAMPCNWIANYLQGFINSCQTNGGVAALQFVNANDVLLSNNAAGNNGHDSSEVLIWLLI